MPETKTYQGHTYTRNGPNDDWTLIGPAPTSRVQISGPDPYRVADEHRKDVTTSIESRRADLQAQNNNRENSNSRLEKPQKLRTEWEQLQEVQNYRVALEQAHRAMNTDANPQGDLALTYAFAKAMDPQSAVRYGENQMAVGTQPWLQAAAEAIKKQFGMSGAGTFTPQARAALRQQVFRQLSSLKLMYDARRADAIDNALANGINPKEVVGRDDTATYAPSFRAYAEKNGDAQGVVSGIIGGDPIKPGGNAPIAPDMKAGGPGATQTAVDIPAAMQQEHAQYLAQHWGQLDPRDYAAFRTNLDAKYGLTADPSAYANDAPKLNDYARKGGSPDQIPGIPGPMRNMTAGEQLWNDIVSSPAGTTAATAMNGIGFGIPEMLNGTRFDALRHLNPKAALAGDIGGGVAGALSAGGLAASLGERFATPKVAQILAKPLAGDLLYGGAYGGTTAAGHGDNVLLGVAEGLGGAYLGNRVGAAIGKALPSLTGLGGEVRALDETVPSSQALKDQASSLYQQAEARGLTATPDETYALADTTRNLLSQEGRLTPADRLTEVQQKVKEFHNLVGDYAGQPMTPTQFQAVRSVASDAAGSLDPQERRIGKMLLDNLDNWSDATNPDLAAGLRDARGVASRYLQGDQINMADQLADARAGNYTQAGRGNAVRTDFRALDRAIIKGQESFAPNVVDAIQAASRGTPLQNALRYVGKLAPTGQMGMYGTLGMAGAGAHYGGPLGAAGPVALALLGTGARKVEANMGDRAAQVAENAAYGGPEYSAALDQILGRSASRGSDLGTGLMVGGVDPRINDLIARALIPMNAEPLPQ